MQVDDAAAARLAQKLNKEDPTPEIFDEIQRKVKTQCCAVICVFSEFLQINKRPSVFQVYDQMLKDERYYPSFKQHPLYVRMLAELDMLKEPSFRGSDDGDGGERTSDRP